MMWKRHTFIDISDTGRETILTQLAGTDDPGLRETYARVILPRRAGCRVPAVVRREDGAVLPGCVPVGFSEVLPHAGRRLRIPAFAREEDITGMMTPYEMISLPMPRRTNAAEALMAVRACAVSLGLNLGVWGSMALELYTTLPCTGEQSDLDLLVEAASGERLSCFLTGICALEERFSLRMDVEVDLPNGYGVQLRELTGDSRMVLGKGAGEVVLLPREEILTHLRGS